MKQLTGGSQVGRIHIERGDIATYRVDAIVNAANSDLVLGGGVAGAIARAGGSAIQAACTRHGPIKVGQAAITTAGRLPARYVIHAASMALGTRTTADALADSVRASLDLAEKRQLKSIALPAIGTGIAGFAVDACAKIMLEIIHAHLSGPSHVADAYVVLFDEQTYRAFLEEYQRMTEPGENSKKF